MPNRIPDFAGATNWKPTTAREWGLVLGTRAIINTYVLRAPQGDDTPATLSEAEVAALYRLAVESRWIKDLPQVRSVFAEGVAAALGADRLILPLRAELAGNEVMPPA